MNICVCTVQVPFVKGGAEIMAENLMTALVAHGHKAERINIPFKWYPKEQILRDCLVWRLLDITESYFEKIDLVIALKFPAYLVRHPRKIVWMAHQYREVYDCYGTDLSGFSSNEEDDITRQAIFRWDFEALTEAQGLFAISQNVSRRLLRYNGLESQHLYVPPKLTGQYLNPQFDDFIFCPGRLEVSKRVDLLIKTMAKLPPPIKCLIAGKGPQEAALKQLTADLGLQERVKFYGYLPDEVLLKMYSEAYAVYFAPYDEDLGLITLETFHARKPVVTCHDSGAVLEFVENDVTGLVTETQPESLRDAFIYLFENKTRCQEMGEAGYQKIEFITWDYVIESLIGS
ncbi:glycosyltransferase family 4 protein [candidate division CSSED10-310 bacterium]|uniref:Glycosyltransferase family 4 protein n=1 Tax=candidate division CSSED10-310 bacterium TaxID=2855610 RepID=A0ABV6Z6F3_UNCC1